MQPHRRAVRHRPARRSGLRRDVGRLRRRSDACEPDYMAAVQQRLSGCNLRVCACQQLPFCGVLQARRQGICDWNAGDVLIDIFDHVDGCVMPCAVL